MTYFITVESDKILLSLKMDIWLTFPRMCVIFFYIFTWHSYLISDGLSRPWIIKYSDNYRSTISKVIFVLVTSLYMHLLLLCIRVRIRIEFEVPGANHPHPLEISTMLHCFVIESKINLCTSNIKHDVVSDSY